jgi:sterol desaturase/sphingolipid hydroxylase (fatty acid hydroxylase superfamily)
MAWLKMEGAAYWALFVATFLAVAVWESFQHKRPLSSPAERRWSRHAILLAISGVVQTAVLRVTPAVVAWGARDNPFGVLNRPWIPFLVGWVVCILVLDLVRYGMHRAFHSISYLWRVHEVHHSDPDFDVSTAGRFHPLEVVSTQALYLAVIWLLAPPPLAVFAAELLALVLNLFAHANASLPGWAEKLLRVILITPDLHRIHHSEEIGEQSRNFGQTFPWWDRLFGTYLAEPAAGEEGLVTGIKGLQNGRSLGLGFMLAEPFRSRSESQTEPVA